MVDRPDVTVLIVEDEAQIRKFLRISLEAHGMHVREARRGGEGIELAIDTKPDLVVLDLGLPDMDGKDVIARVREWSAVPILVLSVRAEEREKIAALDAGANDYVTKPFGIGEFMARIRVLLRAEQMEDEQAVFRCGELTVDLAHRRVRLAGEEIKLTRKEYDLLKLFAQHSGQVLTHHYLLEAIWGPAFTEETHYLRVLVGHLRQKLRDDPARPRFIVTEPGVGYRMKDPDTAKT